MDEGEAWAPLGKVTRAASATATGSAVLAVARPGAVAGVGAEELLLRLPSDGGESRSLRIVAQGEAANIAAIATNIPARGSLFRCLAPPLGSRVLLERGGKEGALPANYVPRDGDRLLIVAPQSSHPEPPSVIVENWAGGEVILAATGGVPRVLARVKQPLRGVGRYMGTERAGNGCVVNWGPTAVTVSTAGTLRRLDEDGQPTEERGGFVIQPAEPRLQGATHPPSQLLLEAVPEGDTKPAVSRFFSLPAVVSNGDPIDRTATHVEVRLDEGEWEPFPDLRGAVNEENMLRALQNAVGPNRKLEKGITHLRITFGAATEAGLRRRVQLATTPAAKGVQRDVAQIRANVMGEGVELVAFYLNGKQVKLTNIPSGSSMYVWEWDTRSVPNGEHLIEIRGLDANGAAVTTVLTKVIVDN